MTVDNEDGFKAPYVSWQMIVNQADRMKTEGIPARVDRSYLGNASGTTKAQFLAAAKALRLLDGDLKPTEVLKRFVLEPDLRPEITRSLLQQHYAPAIALGTNATQQQLEEVFRETYGISGSTVRKAIAFYLAAAKYAKLDVSPHFSMPRTSGTTAGTRRRKTAKAPAEDAMPPAADPRTALQTKYIESLLEKFAGSNGEVDPELANRIERLLGFEAPAAPAESES